jgi:hypothetical protein
MSKIKTDYIKELAALKMAGVPDEKELHENPEANVVISKGKVRAERTLGNPMLIAQSQKMYRPELQGVKGANQQQTSLGTAAAADITGSWGKPANV